MGTKKLTVIFIARRLFYSIVPNTMTLTRLEQIKKRHMKKQAANKNKKAPRVKEEEVPWYERACKLPVALFHTTVGPIIGRVESIATDKSASFGIRLWAPAVLTMGFTPETGSAFTGVKIHKAHYTVTFKSLAFIETYIDLSSVTPFGRSPVPEALLPAYEEYFDKAAAGEYMFNRILESVEQAVPHTAPVTGLEEARKIVSGGGLPTYAPNEMSEADHGECPVPPEQLPWAPGTDPHAWLTRKVYELEEDEVIEQYDLRRTVVKRAFFGWAHDAPAEEVAEKFNAHTDSVQRVYDVINEELSAEDQSKVRRFLNPRRSKFSDEENRVS